ncbi:MAG: hypothetical protein IT280_06140 [Ignavibacteria bacterium]|nr:hypothetical protein [Ignavibacteria bacterium]
MNTETFNILFNFLPEITLAVIIIILNIVNSANSRNTLAYYIYAGGIIAAVIFTLMQAYYAQQILFSGAFTADSFGYAGRLIVICLMAYNAIALCSKNSERFYFSFSLLSALGVMLAIQASNIFVFFTAIMVVMIPLYLIHLKNLKTSIKYYIVSSVLTAVLLYGATLLYGLSASGDYLHISGYISLNPFNTLVLLMAVLMIILPLAFYANLAPVNLIYPLLAEEQNEGTVFHFTIVNTVAVLFIIARFIFTVLHDSNIFIQSAGELSFIQNINWKLLLAVISACSMVFGSFVLLWQYDLKKIFTYITISQAGYLLMGLIAGSRDGLSMFVFGVIVFAINSAALLYIIKLIKIHFNTYTITELKTFGSSNKFLFVTFIYFLVSSAGFPLTAGFNSKLLLYSLSGLSGFIWLIIVGIVSQTVFLYFIFRQTIYFFSAPKNVNKLKLSDLNHTVLLILLISAIFISVVIYPFTNWANYCSKIFGI